MSRQDKTLHMGINKYVNKNLSITEFNTVLSNPSFDKDTLKEMIESGIDYMIYFNITEHKMYNKYIKYINDIPLAEYREIDTLGINYTKIIAMSELGIDHTVFDNVSEHTYYTRYNVYNPGTTLEEFREIRANGIDFAKFIEAENLKVVAFQQNGDEDAHVDFLTKTKFAVTDYSKSGNAKLKEIIGETLVTERPEHHHFVLHRNASVMKHDKMEPSQLIKTDILSSQESFIEFMGTMMLGKTTHKLMHGPKFTGEFDIHTALKLGIAPWWAQSESNYKELQNKYPGVIDDITFEEMIGRFTLENYLNGTYVAAKKVQAIIKVSIS